MIRPLFIAPFGDHGGSESVLRQLLSELDDRFEPRALVMTEGPLADQLREQGVPTDVEHLPGKSAVARFPSACRSVAARLRGERISLIHANGIKAAIFGIPLAARLGVPLLWMKHDHVLDGWPTRVIGARCERVVCVTEAMASQFPPRMGRRISVAYPGVRLPSPSSLARTAPLVVSAGRLDPAKGFTTLLRAVAVMRERGSEGSIAIAGPVDRVFPEHGDELRALVHELDLSDRAEVLGWMDSLSDLYRKARVVASATRPRRGGRPGEAAPIVLQEGMSHGRPVIGPREAGIAEIVGDAGTLVDELTPEALADALEPYLADASLAARVGARGRERVERRYTVAHTAANLSDLYCELAGSRFAGDRGPIHPAPRPSRP